MSRWPLDSRSFVANKDLDEQQWLEARRGKITATLIAKASTRAGFDEALQSLIVPPPPIDDNAYMEFGRRMEPTIALWLKDEYGVLPNSWLIAHSQRQEFVATPDGIHLATPVIAEIKTTGKDWETYKQVPIQYRRQVQWQMFVTGAEQCVFAWMLRAEVEGRMVPAWMEPRHVIVDRDEKHISELLVTAEDLWEKKGTA